MPTMFHFPCADCWGCVDSQKLVDTGHVHEPTAVLSSPIPAQVGQLLPALMISFGLFPMASVLTHMRVAHP